MRVAAIDLGTNTFILLIAEVEGGQIKNVLCDEVRVVRLGQGVHQTREFHPEALLRAEECFREFQQFILQYRPKVVSAVATSAARDVKNSERLIQIGRRYGIPIEVISGTQEAEYTYWGTLNDRLQSQIIIIDIGGGSTEYILGDASGLVAKQSIDIGSVRLTEMFVTKHPIVPTELKKMEEFLRERLKAVNIHQTVEGSPRAIAVAGTPTTLAAVDMGLPFESERVSGYHLSSKALDKWVHLLAGLSVEKRQALAGMEAKRADVIVAGALILRLSCEHLKVSGVEVSVRGLRYGLAKSLGATDGP